MRWEVSYDEKETVRDGQSHSPVYLRGHELSFQENDQRNDLQTVCQSDRRFPLLQISEITMLITSIFSFLI